jgi:hypothetical protein
VVTKLLRPGERIVPARREDTIGTKSLFVDQYRIGLIRSEDYRYVRIKIPRAIWDWEDGWVRSIVDTNNAIIAFLIARIGPDTPVHEKYVVKKWSRPFFELRVSSKSKMRGNRYPKVASSVTENGVTRVDVPETIEIKIVDG